jgi:hypothetical protein
MSDKIKSDPVDRGFRYEVSLAVAIPTEWADLLKLCAKYHYDRRCRESGDGGVVNGLKNTACDGPWSSVFHVTWSDLDLVTKVAEQLESHTSEHHVTLAIRSWLRTTMKKISDRHELIASLTDEQISTLTTSTETE